MEHYMITSLIAAISKNNVIGKKNKLPWHLPADLQHFKKMTMGKPIIMGRKTFESIGRPLPQRDNIVVTRQTNFKATGCIVAHSLDEALARLKEREEVFIIGGAELYKEGLFIAENLYLT